MIIARTQRLILRQFYAGDAGAMDRVFGDAEVMRYGDGVRTAEWVRSWLARWGGEYYPQWGFGMWAVVEASTSDVIGYCGLTRFPGRCATCDEAEIGFRLARTHCGRGFAAEAAMAVRDYAFDVLHVPRLIALIDPANLASVRVVRKLGFRYDRDAMLEGYDHPDHVYSLTRPPDIAVGRAGGTVL
jgi:[ribosomal protein S5]-alanine N-acetyltransferase